MPLDCPRSIGTACTARSRLGLGVKERGANGLSGQGKAMTEGKVVKGTHISLGIYLGFDTVLGAVCTP